MKFEVSFLRVFLQLQPSNFKLHTFQKPPIIVKLVDAPRDPTGIADVVVGALGLTTAIVLLAVLLGVVLAGVMFWVRSRQNRPRCHY